MGHVAKMFWPLAIWLVAAMAIVTLYETPAWSTRTFVWVAGAEWAPAGALSSTIVMLLLMVLYVGMLVHTWFIKDRLAFVRLICGGIFAVVTYVINLVLKGNYEQLRPCHQIQLATQCPPVDNFSYPSNHTVIAFGLAAGLALPCRG